MASHTSNKLRLTDSKIQGKKFDARVLTNMTEEQAEIYFNTHAKYAICYWETFNIEDFELWEKFGEQFDE